MTPTEYAEYLEILHQYDQTTTVHDHLSIDLTQETIEQVASRAGYKLLYDGNNNITGWIKNVGSAGREISVGNSFQLSRNANIVDADIYKYAVKGYSSSSSDRVCGSLLVKGSNILNWLSALTKLNITYKGALTLFESMSMDTELDWRPDVASYFQSASTESSLPIDQFLCYLEGIDDPYFTRIYFDYNLVNKMLQWMTNNGIYSGYRFHNLRNLYPHFTESEHSISEVMSRIQHYRGFLDLLVSNSFADGADVPIRKFRERINNFYSYMDNNHYFENYCTGLVVTYWADTSFVDEDGNWQTTISLFVIAMPEVGYIEYWSTHEGVEVKYHYKLRGKSSPSTGNMHAFCMYGVDTDSQYERGAMPKFAHHVETPTDGDALDGMMSWLYRYYPHYFIDPNRLQSIIESWFLRQPATNTYKDSTLSLCPYGHRNNFDGHGSIVNFGSFIRQNGLEDLPLPDPSQIHEPGITVTPDDFVPSWTPDEQYRDVDTDPDDPDPDPDKRKRPVIPIIIPQEEVPMPNPIPLPDPVIDDGKEPDPIIIANKSNFVLVYNPDSDVVAAFTQWLWGTSWNLTTLKAMFSHPLDAIIGFYAIYADLPFASVDKDGNPYTIVLGNIDTEIECNVVTEQYITLPCGEVHVDPIWGNSLDYTNITASIYLPFIGIKDFPTNDIIDKDIKITYKVDVYTGACVCFININNQLKYQYDGNCAVQLPLSAANYTELFSSAVAATTAISQGNLSGGFRTAADSIMFKQPTITKSGSFTSNVGAMGVKTPYIILTIDQAYWAEGYNELEGYPSNKYVSALTTCHGFTRVKEVKLDIAATEFEKDEIKRLLKEGVFI